MQIAVVRLFPNSRTWRQIWARICQTFTSPSQVWKISSCTIPEGACAIELENFWRDAGTRRPRSAAQWNSTFPADLPAAVALCFHFRQGDGWERLSAARVQKPSAPWHYCDQHGLHRNLGGGHAAHCRVSVDPRNRRPSARPDWRWLDRDRKSHRRNAAS